MVFSILIILFIGVIAYFHFVQGFFSATISAMITVLAAVLAVSYHETLVNTLLKGKMADAAHGIALCIIFALIYIVLRFAFDSFIPGNVRVPSTVDKAGAIVMGIIAGICVTGVFSIAVQTLPFDPGISFMGYSRYPLRDNPSVQVPTLGTYLDSAIHNEMEDVALTPDKEKGMLVPVDDWVLDTVYHLSDGGSLAGDRTLSSVHPDYLQELFGQRLGIQTGARRVALQYAGNTPIDVTGAFTAAALPAMDGQNKDLRPAGYTPLYKDQVKPTGDQSIVVLRIKAGSGSTDDDDHLFRFSAGSIHIVGKGPDPKDPSKMIYRDFYPIGTLENANTVLLNKPDDFLVVKEGDSFDLVFVVDQSLLAGGKGKKTFAPETFVSVKRFANLDLSGQELKTAIPYDASVAVIRNAVLADKLKKSLPAPSATPVTPAVTISPPAAPAQPSADAGRDARDARQTPAPSTPPVVQARPDAPISDTLTATPTTAILTSDPVMLGTTNTDPQVQNALVAGGSMTLQGGLIASAKVDPTATVAELSQGAQQASKFYVPDGRAMIQIAVHPYETNWSWLTQLSATQLIDSNGNSYPPSGFYALAKSGDVHALLLRYDASHALSAVAAPDPAPEGNLYLIFLIPHDTDLKTLKIDEKQQALPGAPVHVQ